MGQRSVRNIRDIKKALSNELLVNLRLNGEAAFDALLKSGYSYEEITELLIRYQEASGLDLINCNEAIKSVRTR